MSKPPRARGILSAVLAEASATPTRSAPVPEAEPQAPKPEPVKAPVVKLAAKPEPAKAEPVGKGTLKQRAHQMSVYLEPPVYDQLRDIAHVERTKLHALLMEGVDLVLKKRGAPSIRQLLAGAGSQDHRKTG